jgi:hypothetical protein
VGLHVGLVVAGVAVGALVTSMFIGGHGQSVSRLCLGLDPWGRIVQYGGGSSGPVGKDDPCPAGTCTEIRIESNLDVRLLDVSQPPNSC